MGNFMGDAEHYLSVFWHYAEPVWHWTAGQAVTAVTVLSKAATTSGLPRETLIYSVAVAVLVHFAPRVIKKVRR